MSYPYQQPVYPASYPVYQNPYQQMQQPVMPSVPQPLQQASNIQQTMPQTISPINTQQPIQPAMQNGGFAFVKNEQEARDYPVAPGNYMTFKDEHAPYMYEKSKSFSQLEEPTFEKYRLTREIDAPQAATEPQERTEEVGSWDSLASKLRDEMAVLGGEVDDLKNEIDVLRKELRGIGEKKPAGKTRKEDLTHE